MEFVTSPQAPFAVTKESLGNSTRRPNTEDMGNRIGQLWSIESVEMKLSRSVGLQHAYLLCGHDGRDHATQLRIVLDTLEYVAKPVRHRRAASCGESDGLRVVGNGHDAGHVWCSDACSQATITETEIGRRVKEVLSDRAAGPGIQLTPEVVEGSSSGLRALARVSG